ncbi:DUF4221 domain-containing protein [Echinicola soli]|uniref:DUF4221 domain-containing protein n=1 Tax=Echinicola soli TaxID=2591634 RepID=A0A514CHB1_9BACT|nr:DUF4221 family protein [Echinicola soli]QDH79211.1 DUF4221 domain-containing protein [Echinicola soli]
MRLTHFWLLILLASACKQHKTDSSPNPTTYSMDTVFIDAKGEILDVDYSLFYSAIVPDQPFLYNFNHFDNHLEKIHLDKRELVSKVPFQKEGPNGTGTSLTSFQFFGHDRLLISDDLSKAKVFDLKGKVLKNINLRDHSWKGEVLSDTEKCRQKLFVDHGTIKLLTLVREEGLKAANTAELALFDLKNDSIVRFDIDPEGKIKKYSLISEDNSYLRPQIFLSIENNTPILSHQFTNEIYWYDSISKKITEVDYSGQLTPNEVSTELGNMFESTEQLFEVFEKMNEQIRFGPLVYDQKNEQYYRFSFQSEFKSKSERESLTPEIKSVNAYLTIFDNEFNVINESLIPEFNRPITHYFARDGKLWILNKENDEMAFVRIEFNYPSGS